MILGAVTVPDITIDDVRMLPTEANWLIEKRIQHNRDLERELYAVTETVLKTNEEIAELETDAAALPAGAERDVILAQIATIEAGQVERGKMAAKKIRRAVAPSPNDARKKTVRAVFNNGILVGDTNLNGTLGRAESGWPNWLFNLADTDQNNQLSPAELTAYVATL
jgi:hypothetical protein